MEFRTRRLLSMVVVCSYLFLGGVEFAVILPTAWEYLQSIGVHEEYLLGVTVAAYSLSAAIAGVLGGRWSDKHPRSTRSMCMVCICAMVVGNLLYLLGINVWNIVISRFICGLGTAAGAALLAYVCRTTTALERTAMLSVCNACRQMGILIGPAFQLLLTTVDFQIGPLSVTRLNAAGLFMAVLWVLFIFICLGLFRDLTHEWRRLQRLSEQEPPTRGVVGISRTLSFCESITVAPPEEVTFDRYSDEILRDTVMSLLGTVFTLFFGQILIETLIPVYMKEYFLLGDVETSFMYMAGGVECLLMLLAVVGLSRVVPDWSLHLAGLLLVLSGFAWLCATLPHYRPGDTSDLIPFIACCLIIGAGYPITNVANASLISKCLSIETQGTGQGLRRLMSYLGLVLGPLWAGAAARRPLLMMGVAVGLVLLQLVLFLDVLPRLVHVERAARRAARLLRSGLRGGEETPLLDPSSQRSSSQSDSSLDLVSDGFAADNDTSISSLM